ncbi:neural-cadherin-like [Watersipora subatra]|uniref:neural-cadherin-like n=1 Tax=Watersipora subatra TaxID=2589382 RepID=UPI00355B9090
MNDHSLLAIGALFIAHVGCAAATTQTYYGTVGLTRFSHGRILVLPNINGTIKYWKIDNRDVDSQPFAITKDGTVYSLSPLVDIKAAQVSFGIGALDTLSGKYSSHRVVIEVLHSSNSEPVHRLHRFRRASDISISTTVQETVREVNLDYSGQGIPDDPNNRYYLLEENDTPFSHAELTSGKLVVSQSSPLDYETAPSHQYSVTVLVNNTGNSNEYNVAVTIILLDVNDETPVFTMQPFPYLATIDPNLPANSKVDYLITVSDSDATSFLVFSLLEGSSKFRINQNGELHTNDRLSADITYTVKVKVVDENAESNTQTAEAVIKILAGQRPPQFYEDFYQATTPENLHGAQLDVTIKAKSFQGDAISFGMIASQIFIIEEVPNTPNEAKIRITTSLDYEMNKRSHMLTITARERGTGLSSTVQLNIIVVDLNDNSPIFDLTQYVADQAFSEDVLIGTKVLTVRAFDADSVENGNDNGRITYSLQSDVDPALPFRVETVETSSGFDGIIKVSGKLDYDRTDPTGYIFRVVASDGGVPPKSGSAYVRVQVQNTNDERPQFAAPGFLRIESTKPVDSVVTTVFASDPDGDKVAYALIKSEPSSAPFRINSASGTIFLTQSLDDFNDVSSFVLNVSATDDGSCCEQGSASTNVGYLEVTIEIVGRNNAPEFTFCSSYSGSAKAPENTVKAFVIQVSAQDADVGPNGNLTYSLVGSDADLFTIEEYTGRIYTKEMIDREQTNQLTITVKAEDQGLSQLSTFCTFTMTVQDLNDNDPRLNLPDSQVVKVDLPAGSVIYSVFATDPDYDINGTNGLAYTVTGNSNFEMDGNDLKNKYLGISLPERQSMTIVVKDHGNRTVEGDFIVNIRQTAEAPRFLDIPGPGFNIAENLEDDEIIYKIKAVSATGGPVNYFLVPSTTLDAFYMRTDDQDCNDNNRLCLAIYQSKNLDADKLRFYKLRVRVTPQDSGSVVKEETVDIELTDVNDNIPVFENLDINGFITGSVTENSTVFNAEVCVVKANDSDITEEFKTKSYSLLNEGDSELFRVDPSSGIIRVDKDIIFDRESKSEYIIKVMATDGAPSSRPQAGGNPNSAVATVQVLVNDINDNPPYFPQQRYTGSVEETAAKGKLVTNIRANDIDIENNFQYRFITGNENQAFEITTTGDVLVLSPGRLDYETRKEYEMLAEVSDGRYQATTSVLITLIDMNDNVPVFSKRIYTVKDVVEEDNSISPSKRLFIVQVTATDGDVDRPNNIEYSLSGSYSDRFQIESDTGRVYLVRPLDRDNQPQWDINVLASDEPGSPTNRIGYAIISVFPLDINDNHPIFNENTLAASVKENDSNVGQILAIQADDKDAGSNGTVRFRLLETSVKPDNYPPQGYPYFAIDLNGVVTSTVKFDRERVDRYTFKVVAYDLGTPAQLSSTATVTITIEDVNDNPPKFEPDFYETRVSELAGPLSFILQVNVADLDSTAVFSYWLNDEALKNFSIDASGNIYIRDQQRLDYEHFFEKNLPPEMSITVTVSDGDYQDEAVVNISLVDENDETPIFDRSSVTVTRFENVTIDTLVNTFVATDRDAISTPRNSEIEYLIDRTSDFNRYFKISPQTGEVRTQRKLDREMIDTHTVRVLAVDNGYPVRRTGTATLIVQLIDINDNGPRLVTPIVYIEENYPINSSIIPREIRAIDDDDNTVGHGPPFRMAATNGSQNSRDFQFSFHPDWDVPEGFQVPNGAGQLRTRRVLDREGANGPQIDFYLRLSDKDEVSASRLLTVIVADEDDNPPSSGRRETLIYNYKGQYELVEIGDCYAEDKDDWDRPHKNYEKVGNWPDGFSINADSGMISADLTIVASGTYDIRCKVIDNYISDPNCALNCNSRDATRLQTDVCKDACRTLAEAISDVSATIKTIDEAPIWNGVSIRLKGTSEEFMQRRGGKSPYEIFIERLADSLGTEQQYVDVFSVLDSNSQPGFVDVRFTAHGSPYYNSTRLIGAVLDDKGLEEALGMTVAQVPINECLLEVCAGGCTNLLSVSNEPTLVNANGSSLVGVTSRVERVCACSQDNGSFPQMCTPDSCLHGGQCIYNRDSETTSCQCPFAYDGPRCQQLRHSFNGAGWAQYKTLSQCTNSSTTIEFITKQSDAMILYNGPLADPGTGPSAVLDYLLIAITDGKPVVYINLGTGHVKLSIDKIVSNGIWHKLELVIVDRRVTLTLDDCDGAQMPDPDTSEVGGTRASCQDSEYTLGENRLLNVASLLEMGGRAAGSGAWWPAEVASEARGAYDGCVRSFYHNGELYDLHVGNIGRQENSEDGCRREDDICMDSNGAPVCGTNGICEATLNGAHSCTCKPGWRGDGCSTATGYMDLKKDSFIEWKLLVPCSGSSQCMLESYRTDIQLSFRSRDIDNTGLLFYVTGNSGNEYIKVMIVGGQLQLLYDIGSDSIDTLIRGQIITLPVIVTDGDLHTVRVTRVGKRFTLSMDGGEGRYSVQHEDVYSHQLFIADGAFYSGGDGPYISGGTNVTASTDLENTCITDVRYNDMWFPSTLSENSDRIELVRKQNVGQTCVSDGCSNVNCPGLQECRDLWRDYECSCPEGYETLYADPYCLDINECFPDSPCVHGTCENLPGDFDCVCDIDPTTNMLYIGRFCNQAPSKSVLELDTSGIVVFFLSLFVISILALAIFCYVTRRSRMGKDETLLDSYNDVRETIYNYDEEGMPEEDQDGYDISRLSRPFDTDIKPTFTEPLGGAMRPPSNHPPDVADFITGRLNDADDDPTNCPGDEFNEYDYEGNGSDAGTLSSLNSASSEGDQEFDHLQDWGPKFARLADMYKGEE